VEIPRQVAPSFPAVGSALQRYASRFTVAEINSSFHRPHRPSTWDRWRDSVPPDFRFSVKLPKQITHKLKLVDCGEELNLFLSQAEVLGDKLAVLLVQLPPKLEFAASVADDSFARLADRSAARIACEPRHPSWFTKGADELLRRHCAARVAADPAIVPAAARADRRSSPIGGSTARRSNIAPVTRIASPPTPITSSVPLPPARKSGASSTILPPRQRWATPYRSWPGSLSSPRDNPSLLCSAT
jgi:hypothetical protein